ncbi:MAG TPA: mechanosensitive ion channel family protein [Pyrinomonadaceae bacterium]|nr:mechanosensitive ion channel family protein [Pyrinomonadaceae bacterium]
MPASEFRKKAVVFAIFTGLVILILAVLIPFAEDQLYAYFVNRFGLRITPDGYQPPAAGDPRAGMMVETAVSLSIHLFRIIKIILWMAIVISIIRFFGYMVLSTIRGSQSEVSSLIKTVLSVILYIVSFFIIFQTQYPDVPLAPLFTGSTILGIVVGLALQDTLGNLFAGIAIQADQPFQVGDVITMTTNRGGGVVESVSWRGVKIRTFQNKLLVMSNSILGKEIIEVAPRGNLNARVVTFNTEYTDSPSRTIQVVRDAVRQVENVSQKIRPVVRIKDFGADGLDWEVKYWTDDYTKHNDTDALIRQRIWYTFNREKIVFGSPSRTVHMAPPKAETTLVDYVNIVSDKLQQIPLFAPLAEEEVERLAKASSTRVYAPGEAIVRRGQEGNSMFVIVRGAVKVQIPESDYQKTINNLKANDFFGEMSLLTGQPRTATVIAEEETEVIQIKKTALRPLFEANPHLMKAISDIIEERRELLVETAEEEERIDEPTSGVLTSLRKFFGIR